MLERRLKVAAVGPDAWRRRLLRASRVQGRRPADGLEGIAAAVAIPDISTTNPNRLDLAAEEIAQAIRFARSESLRTGEIHGVHEEVRTRFESLNG